VPEGRGEIGVGKMSTRMALVHFSAVPSHAVAPQVRRKVTAQAGRAMNLLAHALEYLSDECAIGDDAEPSLSARIEAIALLMAVNRGIYMECPEVPTAGARCRAILRRCFHLRQDGVDAASQGV